MPYLGHQYYEATGSGPALVLLHGHTLDHRMWAEHVEALSGQYRVITPDVAAHGLSGWSPDGKPLCDDLAALLDHLEVDRAAICGLSMGGMVAVSFALHHPERCLALIPVDSALFGHRLTTWNPVPYIQQAQSEGLGPALEAWLADPLFAPAMATPAAERIRGIVREYPGAEWLTRPTYPPVPPGPAPEAERLGEIKAPTLVIVGEHDLDDFQAVATRLATSIPGARKAVIPGAGHMVPMEEPKRFRAILTGFLAETLRNQGA